MDHRVLLSVYYIDRCELWGFIREINSGIFTYENISFFPPELLLHNYKCGGYVPCCVTVNTHTIVNWKKFLEMSLTTLTHYQHDVIDVMWKLPVWLIDWLIDWLVFNVQASNFSAIFRTRTFKNLKATGLETRKGVGRDGLFCQCNRSLMDHSSWA